MPKVIIAKDSGFCFGVRRAQSLLDLAVKNGKKLNKKVKMVGPLIHNPRLIKEYENDADFLAANLYKLQQYAR